MIRIFITCITLITNIPFVLCTPSPHSSDYCTVHIIRHGETDWNAEGKVQGHTDTGLNAKGQEQAQELKEKLKAIPFTGIFSSDLIRAHQTAEIVRNAEHISIVTSPALRERNMAACEGKLVKDVRQRYFDDGLLYKPHSEVLTYTFDDIETYADTYTRITDFIKTQANHHIGSAILVVSHGSAMRSVLYTLAFNYGHSWAVSNCARITLHVYRDGKIILSECEDVRLVKDAF